jgi:hypothetical protein
VVVAGIMVAAAGRFGGSTIFLGFDPDVTARVMPAPARTTTTTTAAITRLRLNPFLA